MESREARQARKLRQRELDAADDRNFAENHIDQGHDAYRLFAVMAASTVAHRAFRWRVSQLLRHENILTLDALCALPEKELLRIPNVGRSLVRQIKMALATLGRELVE